MPSKIDDRKRQSSLEDEPGMRVLRQREAVENQHHENEVLKLELTREQREAKKSGAGKGPNPEVTRLQDQAAMYVKKIEKQKQKIEETDREIAKYQLFLSLHKSNSLKHI